MSEVLVIMRKNVKAKNDVDIVVVPTYRKTVKKFQMVIMIYTNVLTVVMQEKITASTLHSGTNVLCI